MRQRGAVGGAKATRIAAGFLGKVLKHVRVEAGTRLLERSGSARPHRRVMRRLLGKSVLALADVAVNVRSSSGFSAGSRLMPDSTLVSALTTDFR
jgi:hypothetical protein